MLFGDAHVEETVGEAFLEFVEAGSRRHGGGNRDDLFVRLCFLDKRLRENVGVGGSLGVGLVCCPVMTSEAGHAVILVLGFLCGLVSLALLRDDVDQYRVLSSEARGTFFRTGSKWSRLCPSTGPT